MGVETHKVEIVPVKLEKHPNADKLSVVKVYNFQVCVNTADWQGMEKAAYVQPDSVMPDTPEYRFLKDTSSFRKEREELEAMLAADHESDLCRLDYDQKSKALEAKIDANTKHLRITVKKLRGIISMGMLIPAPEGAQIGDDVAEQLGITHYEPPVEHTGDDVAPAPPLIYAPKYDVESVYRYANCFEAGEPVYVSEKLDGQNARFVTTWGETHREDTPGGQRQSVTPVNFHAGSRTEWKKEEGGSNWWKVLKENHWLNNWVLDNPDFVIYGEIFGWVQSLRYGAKPGELFFRAFDVMEGTEYWDAEKFLADIPKEHRVPDLGIMPFDFEKLQALADGPSLIKGADHMREGIVIKPLKERKHWQLGRVMVKMVSNAYLEKSAR
jgi:RNA ligase (TIGR02306 family)